MKLFSPSQGLKEVDADVTETGAWVDLNFNFVDFQTINDFERLEIVFDKALASSDTWYFDNITQGESTVDPCADVTPIPTILMISIVSATLRSPVVPTHWKLL